LYQKVSRRYHQVVTISPEQLTRREHIIDAARAAIEEHGANAGTAQIAERAGLARPNVYRHFASKDELDREVARAAYRQILAAFRDRVDLPGTPLDVIRGPVTTQVDWARNHPNLYHFLLSQGFYRFFIATGGRNSSRRGSARGDFAAEMAAAGERYFPHFAENRDAAEILVMELASISHISITRWLTRHAETRHQLIERLTAEAWLLTDRHLRQFGVRLDPNKPLPSISPTPDHEPPSVE
jgi:AcrR family transcriptional regulator